MYNSRYDKTKEMSFLTKFGWMTLKEENNFITPLTFDNENKFNASSLLETFKKWLYIFPEKKLSEAKGISLQTQRYKRKFDQKLLIFLMEKQWVI
ncbi:hypothetical protein [Candidatus Mycoplasma mahonii]|uniref:hypothetical protein n=1 Tax=Candidatus Mycoplasma mahonii TaxID=3004105 RepID=UPI0026EFE195|nr:hypothetical protein [Candidatus Mycoplasma mahonii]WKX02176.1 hypothetical protein O3I44_02115 [Candidatus Mycoplasma mahonii]